MVIWSSSPAQAALLTHNIMLVEGALISSDQALEHKDSQVGNKSSSRIFPDSAWENFPFAASVMDRASSSHRWIELRDRHGDRHVSATSRENLWVEKLLTGSDNKTVNHKLMLNNIAKLSQA